jgi:hypothetical protein
MCEDLNKLLKLKYSEVTNLRISLSLPKNKEMTLYKNYKLLTIP